MRKMRKNRLMKSRYSVTAAKMYSSAESLRMMIDVSTTMNAQNKRAPTAANSNSNDCDCGKNNRAIPT